MHVLMRCISLLAPCLGVQPEGPIFQSGKAQGMACTPIAMLVSSTSGCFFSIPF